MPRFDIPGVADILTGIGGRTPETVLNRVYSFQPTVTSIFGNHTIKFGADYRQYLEESAPPFDANGRYRFDTSFTRLNDLSSTAAPFGQELAAFLLGTVRNNTTIQRNTDRRNKSVYHGVFFQDDWRVNSKLTLNLGIRYEYERPNEDEFNRNIRLFDTTSSNPIEAAARAAYTVNFNANPANFPISPANWRVSGGPVFASDENPGFWESDFNNFQPRLGFAYQINSKSVIRGGYAIYHAPLGIDSLNATGFSVDTTAVPTNNNGISFVANLTNPFPTGIVQPFGNSRGLATGIGATLGGAVNLINNTIDRRVNPLNLGERKNPRIQRFQVSFQQELFSNFVVEAAYIASRGNDLTTVIDINAIPRQYLSTSAANDATVQSFLQTNVANPFRNLPEAAGTGFFSPSTLQRQQLLRPFPQFQSVNVFEDDGKN
ncbi:MAG: TonB-dependent receptor, partial [Blastocatellia bacterium]|nr:TonB-dependent receptor [Blastocatellia bacterium]